MAMTKIRFKVERTILMAATNVAYVDEGEDPLAEVVRTAVDDLSVEIMLTINGVTCHLAAWQDPEHWAEEWRELAGDEDPEEFIAGLLLSAIEG